MALKKQTIRGLESIRLNGEVTTKEELITLTQVIQDVKDIEKLFTDYSKTFNLPASKTNNKLFKYWFNPDVNGFNNQIFSTAKIELNHFEFKKGEIQLNEVVMKDNKPTMYKVTFFGETTNFKNAINEDQLSDLVWLNKFNHSIVYDENNNVKAGLQFGLNITADGVVYNDAIIYPLIAHSLSYIYDTSNNGMNFLISFCKYIFLIIRNYIKMWLFMKVISLLKNRLNYSQSIKRHTNFDRFGILK